MKLYRYVSDEESLAAEIIDGPIEIEAKYVPEPAKGYGGHYVLEDGAKIKEAVVGRAVLKNGVFSIIQKERDGEAAARKIVERSIVHYLEEDVRCW